MSKFFERELISQQRSILTATVAFKVVMMETNGREKEKVRMREKEEKRKK